MVRPGLVLDDEQRDDARRRLGDQVDPARIEKAARIGLRRPLASPDHGTYLHRSDPLVARGLRWIGCTLMPQCGRTVVRLVHRQRRLQSYAALLDKRKNDPLVVNHGRPWGPRSSATAMGAVSCLGFVVRLSGLTSAGMKIDEVAAAVELFPERDVVVVQRGDDGGCGIELTAELGRGLGLVREVS